MSPSSDGERLRMIEEAVREFVAEEVTRQLAAASASRQEQRKSPWCTIAEAAAYLRVSERTLERRIKKGRVRSSVIGRRRLLHRDDLDDLARNAAAGEETVPTAPPRRRRGVE